MADANFREQKSCLQTMRELRGERDHLGSGAQRLSRRREPGLKLRRGEEDTPGRSRPRTRPGKRRLFRRGRDGSFPWLRSDKSHARTRGDTQRPEKPPDPTRNKAEKKETSNIKNK